MVTILITAVYVYEIFVHVFNIITDIYKTKCIFMTQGFTLLHFLPFSSLLRPFSRK